jgi:general secretion pathway protein L
LHRRCGRRLPIVLRPPAGWALEREVVLPAAAAEDLGRVLAYEMDRFTPFRSEDVIWDFELLARDRRSGMLRARLSVVPRAGLGELLSLLERIGTPAAFVECQPANGISRFLRIEQARTPRQRWQRKAHLLMGWSCLVLALAVITTPFVRQFLARARVEDRIAALQPQVARAESLRSRIAKAASGNEAIAGEEAREGNALEIMAVLTQLLPDDSYLTSLVLRDGTLTMEGQSAAATKLITALANTSLFTEPAFMAPVTRTERGMDIFALSAKIATSKAGQHSPQAARPTGWR